MSQKKQLFKNTLILAVGRLATQMVTFLLLPLYTFFLSPAEYGIVDLIITYTILLAPTVTLQLEMAVFRFLVDTRENEDEKRRIVSNTMQIVMTSIALLITIYFGVSLFIDIPHGPLVLAVGIVTILLNLCMQIARGLGKNKVFALASIAIALANILASVSLVMFARLGVEGVLGAMLIANTAGLFYIFIRLKLYRYITFKQQDVKLKKELINYALPLIPNGISWWAISLFDRTIIAIFLGVAANGIYAVSSKYAAIFTSIFGIFGMAWTESASMHINDKARQSFFSEVFNMSVRVFGSLGLMLIAMLPLVFSIIIDQQYHNAYLYVPPLIIGAFFNAIVGLYSAIYVARKMTKQVMTTSLIAAGINITLNFTLISFLGLYAAALATAIAYGVMAIYRHYDLKSYIAIKYEKQTLLGLALLYGLVIYLYYLNIPLTNYVNLLIVLVTTLFLNKNITRTLLQKFRTRKITS